MHRNVLLTALPLALPHHRGLQAGTGCAVHVDEEALQLALGPCRSKNYMASPQMDSFPQLASSVETSDEVARYQHRPFDGRVHRRLPCEVLGTKQNPDCLKAAGKTVPGPAAEAHGG